MYKTNVISSTIETAFINNLKICLLNTPYKDVNISQNYDYTKKGKINTAVYFSLGDIKSIGNAYRFYNIEDDSANHTETRHFEGIIKILMLSEEDDFELALYVANALNSLTFIELMQIDGVGIGGINEIQTIKSLNETNNWISEYHLNLKISFNKDIKLDTKIIKKYKLNNKGV